MDQRLVIPAVAVTALVAGELAVILTSTSQHAELRVVGHPEARVFVLLIGWSFVGSGLVAWHRRRTNRFGALMVAVGFAWFAVVGVGNAPLALAAVVLAGFATPPLEPGLRALWPEVLDDQACLCAHR